MQADVLHVMKNYIRILRPDPSSTPDDIKKRYRELVKKNHPDLFPEDKRREQNLILMEINEAYLSVIASSGAEIPQPAETSDPSFSMPAIHKDPAYAWYKSATDHLNKGNYIFNWSRYAPRAGRYHFDVRKGSLMKTAAEALEHYRMAYGSFIKVCTVYPASIWAADSMEKLDFIEKLNERYNEIIERHMTGC